MTAATKPLGRKNYGSIGHLIAAANARLAEMRQEFLETVIV